MNFSGGFRINLLLIGSVLAACLYLLATGNSLALYSITIGYYGYDTLISCLFLVLTGEGLQRGQLPGKTSPGPIPSLSILVAAHNESSCILGNLRSILQQTGVDYEILVASDGSTDPMNETIIREFTLVPDLTEPGLWVSEEGWPLQLLVLPKVGKATALNGALLLAKNPVVVTLDADTSLAPKALHHLACAFQKEETMAAGGFIYVRNAVKAGWLARYQFIEYLKNFMWRIGLSHAGVCLQVSGAFGAIRTEALRHSGGFQAGSLTEDYEIIYRLHRNYRRNSRPCHIAMVPAAVAYTDCPENISSLVRQRARWFTGFLQTLWDYRSMIGNPAFGRIGLGILPIKCLDAILPLWGLSSFLILSAGLLSGKSHLTTTALLIFGSKWLIDMITVSTLFRWHRRFFHSNAPKVPFGVTAFCVMTEGLIFHWLRHVAVLQAYGWWVGRINHWEQPRWKSKPAPADADSCSP